MLRSLKDLEQYKVSATDGDIGTVVSFLFDDERWTIRYLVTETGSAFTERQVLISPTSFRHADWGTGRFHVNLTVDKVKNSPSVDVDQPVSRQHEQEYHSYYGYPYYWKYSGLWGMGAVPGSIAAGWWDRAPATQSTKPGDVHLNSALEVRGYHIHANDEAIGHLEDFIVDDESWEIRYLVVHTSNWWFGKKVLIAPHWAKRVSWEDRQVEVNLSSRQVNESPEWDEALGVNREYEVRLYDYYGRPVYWENGIRPQQEPPPSHAGSNLP